MVFHAILAPMSEAVCMHFEKVYDRYEDVVVATCIDCGAVGTLPRCTGIRRDGERCNAYVLPRDEACATHSRVRA